MTHECEYLPFLAIKPENLESFWDYLHFKENQIDKFKSALKNGV